MSFKEGVSPEPKFRQWLQLAREVVHRSLNLHWNDVLDIYSYIPTIPLAEALALEARRAGSDTHITLMTDDLWFTSMEELPARWLRAPSQAEIALNKAITAHVYLGGPRDARRMRNIPPEKFGANDIGGQKQEEPRTRRRVRVVDLPIGRISPERAEAYGLDYERWQKSYNAALAVDLREIQRKGAAWDHKLKGKRKVQVFSDAGTNLKFETNGLTMLDDGIISPSDARRGFVWTSLPAGKIVSGVVPNSAQGEIHFTDPVFVMGRSVLGLRFSFERGRLVDWSADEHADLLNSSLKPRLASKNVGWFSIGLNPAAEPCMLDNSIVQNDIGIGLGRHPLLEPSRVMRGGPFEATIGPAKIAIN